MYPQRSLFILLLLFTSSSFSEYDRTWAQLGSGFGMFNFQIKIDNENSGWAFEAAAYYHEDFLLDTTLEAGSEKDLETMFKVLAISKLWSAPFNWGYADVGIGIGIGQGDWKSKCRDIDDESFFATSECDVRRGTRLGIPVQASVAIGKYVGLGLSLNAFIKQEDSHAGFLVTLPLGNFTR
jgi:hypothetical protein